MEDDIRKDVLARMKACKTAMDGLLIEEDLKGATNTWSYMIDESKGQLVRLPQLPRGSIRGGSLFR